MAHENLSSIWDNQGRGKVGDLLKDKIQNGSKLSIVSAHFTIYAYEQLREKLQRIDHLNILFRESYFVARLTLPLFLPIRFTRA